MVFPASVRFKKGLIIYIPFDLNSQSVHGACCVWHLHDSVSVKICSISERNEASRPSGPQSAMMSLAFHRHFIAAERFSSQFTIFPTHGDGRRRRRRCRRLSRRRDYIYKILLSKNHNICLLPWTSPVVFHPPRERFRNSFAPPHASSRENETILDYLSIHRPYTSEAVEVGCGIEV